MSAAGPGGSGVQQVSLGTRLQDWFMQLPLTTRSITVLCCAIYIVGLLFGYDDFAVCISPPEIAERLQVYRLLTAGFFHVGFLHLVMNMFAFQALAPSLERSLGSFSLAYLVVLFQVGSSFLNTILAFALNMTQLYPDAWAGQCTIGLSSVLFSFLVLRSHLPHHPSQNMSVFGLLSVPAQWYPWVLLVLFQLIMPEVSFLGHLTGILIAYLYVFGYLERLRLSSDTINRLESSPYLEWVVMKDGYITNTQFGVGGGPDGLVLPTTTAHQQPHNPVASASSSNGGFLGTLQGMVYGPPAGTPATTTSGGATPAAAPSSSVSPGFVPFSGQGHTLR